MTDAERRAPAARSLPPIVAGVLAVALLVAAAGCLDHTLDPNEGMGGGETFIALQRDFQMFRSWERVMVGEASVEGGHPVGARFAYVNRSPAPGEGAFPVGSILVKTVENGAADTWKIHARVKRGGGFNSTGAFGWEWFDLRVTNEDNVVIMWRGEQPPRNHGYESLPGLGVTMTMDGNCNTCHGAARETDFILSAALRERLTR